jgi:cytochrome c553
MKHLYIPGLSVLVTVVVLGIAWINLDLPDQARVHACVGDCYEQYVAERGNITDQQRAAAEAAASASPAELGRTAYAGCAACHGASGQGGIGPQLTGRSQDFIVDALTAYKNRETRGAQSAIMYPSAAALSDADMRNLAAYIDTL